MTIRLLGAADAELLETFLVQHRDSSMFLRSNARRAGLDFHGAAYQADYFGAFRAGAIVAVLAHSWSGMILLQAPESAAELARACVAHSGRAVTGFSGPLAQTRAARAALGLTDAKAKVDFDDTLYALNLAQLRVPAELANGAMTCRPPHAEERSTLVAWRVAYDIELLGAVDSTEQRVRSASFLDAQLNDGVAWVAVVNGTAVALSAFNCALPDIVQLGGIYTPLEQRRRGYARCAVAGSLLTAIERGATRAVLFTQNPNAARCYESLGFEPIGRYGLVLLG